MPEKDTLTTTSFDDTVIEITLSDIVTFLKKSRWAMLVGGFIGLLIGGVYAFSKPNEYTVQVTVLPELSGKSSGLGNLGSLAGLAGIDVSSMASTTDIIRPDLYPNVVQSLPFALDLLKRAVYVGKKKKTISLEAYIIETGTSWTTGVASWFGSVSDGDTSLLDPTNSSGAVQINKEQENHVKELQSRVSALYDKKSGIISIESKMTDPVVAATVARYAMEYLTNYVTSYRTEKARKEVLFLTKQTQDARQRYQNAEVTLSSYRDRNRGLFLNTAKIEEQHIQADYILAQDVYNNLSKQLETAKIKVQQDTPVFKVLEPARVPLKKSGPKRTIMIAVAVVLGLVIGLTMQLLVNHLRKPN